MNPIHSAPRTPTTQQNRRMCSTSGAMYIQNDICRKYNIPNLDWATPIQMSITKHNIHQFTERETTAYSPSKQKQTYLRKGILNISLLHSQSKHNPSHIQNTIEGKFKLDKNWIGYDVVAIKTIETSEEMHKIGAYDEWSKIKLHINKRFIEVKKLFGQDSKQHTGRRPSPLDAKYNIFGYSVK